MAGHLTNHYNISRSCNDPSDRRRSSTYELLYFNRQLLRPPSMATRIKVQVARRGRMHARGDRCILQARLTTSFLQFMFCDNISSEYAGWVGHLKRYTSREINTEKLLDLKDKYKTIREDDSLLRVPIFVIVDKH